uniref:Dihydrolipoamide acetyltransferase component of pyruvate dehydrogenase complex n=1 Tax=Chenopodium quinoa TaxID=63459 RepID=A0A803MU26_CHEQI
MRVSAKIREIFMPALSSTMTEGKIVSWSKSEGDVLRKGESVVVVESDKADMDVETFYDGILAAIVVGEGDSAPVGAPIGILAESEEEIEEAKARASQSGSNSEVKVEVPASPVTTSVDAPAVAPAVARTEGGRKGVATPFAKKLAKQHKVDLKSVSGTGPFGRITPEDVEKAAGIVKPAPAAAVAKNMMESLSVPTFRVGYPIVTDALDALYAKVKKKGVTMSALLAKATAMALVQHPALNSTCKDGKSFSYNSSINIAVAVAINGGLITPVLQDADKVCTFTLSNLGMFGVDRFDAILPPGQGAIMAVGASKPTVVADADGFFSVKNKMLVNVTADHRIIYGADLAAFLQTFSNIIQNPDSLTM